MQGWDDGLVQRYGRGGGGTTRPWAGLEYDGVACARALARTLDHRCSNHSPDSRIWSRAPLPYHLMLYRTGTVSPLVFIVVMSGMG